MNDVPPTPSKAKSRKARTPVPVKPLESMMDVDSTPLGERSPAPQLPALNFCSSNSHGLSLPVLHGALGPPGGGGGGTRPTLLERRTRTGMSMSCLSGLSMDTIHETSRDNGVQNVTSDQVPPATFRGWSNDTADAPAVEQHAPAAAASAASEVKRARRGAPAPLNAVSSSVGGSAVKNARDEKRVTSSFSLVSYNILASRLVTTDRYPDCPPAALGEDYRLKLIREELDLASADLIALQEISVSVYERDDSLGGFLRNERDYAGEFAVITNKTGKDRCELRRRSRDEVPSSTSKGDTGAHLSAMLLPALPISRRESRNGSNATMNTGDDVLGSFDTPLYRDKSPFALDRTPSGSPTLAAQLPSAAARPAGAAGRSPISRNGIQLSRTGSKTNTLRPASLAPLLDLDVMGASGSGTGGGGGGAGTGAGLSSSVAGSSTTQLKTQPTETRRTEMDGLAIFWKTQRFELLETCCVRFNELAEKDTELTPYERKKLQVDSHNVGLVCVLKDIANPLNVLIVSTVHLIWQRVEAQLWQANELVKVVESLKTKYEHAPTSKAQLQSLAMASPLLSRCSQSMPMTLSAPSPKPLPARKHGNSADVRQSDSNFPQRRETSSASSSRPGVALSGSLTASFRVMSLIAGDFNAEPTNPVVAFLTSGQVPETAQTMTYWRPLPGDSISVTVSNEEPGPTVSNVVASLEPCLSGFAAVEMDNAGEPERSVGDSESLSAPPPPCKNWSRKRTVNPVYAPPAAAATAPVPSALQPRKPGPITPPRDGRGEAYRGRRLDGNASATVGVNPSDEPQDAVERVDADNPSALTTRDFPRFDDLHSLPGKCLDLVAVEDTSFDQPDTDRFFASRALSELSAGHDPKHTLFVPCLLGDRSGGDSQSVPSGKTGPTGGGGSTAATAPGAKQRSSDSKTTSCDAEYSVPMAPSSVTSSPQFADSCGWLCECSSAAHERDNAFTVSPAPVPFSLPPSNRTPQKLRALSTLATDGDVDGDEETKGHTTPTHTLRMKDAYESYRAHNKQLVSAVNPSTNMEGKVLDHIFYEGSNNNLLCQSVVKLGEIVDLPNTFFPSDHYMVGAVFVVPPA